MPRFYHLLLNALLVVWVTCAHAQEAAILKAEPNDRMRLLWIYCITNLISDKDSTATIRFLSSVAQGAENAGDESLKAYAQYFQKMQRILFTMDYKQHFPQGFQQAIAVVQATQAWAVKNRYYDIAASCNNQAGAIYNGEGRYGLATEHLLKAHEAFTKIGYEKVPNAAGYLYELGLHFYRFEEYDKALQKLLQATQYPFYAHTTDVSTLTAIALIYACKQNLPKAKRFFRTSMAKATGYKDPAWVGISAGNLGNVFLAEGRYDSALFYHRINYAINAAPAGQAPEDAAKTALSMATVFLRKGLPDSALFYTNAGRQLANRFIIDSAGRLDFRKRLLKVLIDYRKITGDLSGALRLTDSLFLVEQELRTKLDGKILSRAVEKTEAESYQNKLALLQSQKNLAQLRSLVIIALLLASLIVAGVVFRSKWLRRKRQMQLAEKDKAILLAEKSLAQNALKHAEELLNVYVDAVKEKTKVIEHLESELNDLKNLAVQVPELQAQMTTNREKLLAATLLTEQDWQQFRNVFEQVYPGFSYRLKTTYPDLTHAEARFLYLMKLNLSSREMAAMLGISVEAIHKLRYRLRKKLNLEEAESFEGVIHNIT